MYGILTYIHPSNHLKMVHHKILISHTVTRHSSKLSPLPPPLRVSFDAGVRRSPRGKESMKIVACPAVGLHQAEVAWHENQSGGVKVWKRKTYSSSLI